MSKAIKLDNNVYLDSSSIVHNKTKLSDILDYSLNERKIGTWIDGKPLYRKVIKHTINGTTANVDIGLSDVSIVKAEFYITKGLTAFDANTYRWESTVSNLNCYIANGILTFKSYSQDRTGYDLIAIIEYTKTTDQENNE